MNLLSNAVKFTAKGGLTLNVELESKFSSEAWVRFSVVDTGIGISPADQDRIFAPFTQVDSSTTRIHGGTGLGLSIASELIHAMGGSHTVRSELGQGSTFSFTVPLLCDAHSGSSQRLLPKPAITRRAAENGESFEAEDAPCPPLNVLLAEDTPTNQMLVVHALEKRGHHVQVAGDGRTAVDQVATGSYDIVLMDLQMPEMDGFQATAAIRGLPDVGRVPIIALTAHAMVGDRERCLAAGMDGYLAKPLNLRELAQLVESSAQVVSDAKEHGIET
jgi:CheY-like chemotaxis protein